MKKHINIPVFIPHLGCPNNCVFCNQRFISGHGDFDPSTVRMEIEDALSTKTDDQTAEIAFFGGSFTGIDRDLMIELLSIADSYVKDGRVNGIRLSTRPDYISRDILDILARYPVNCIELGIQSMSDTVLSASKRGHTRDNSITAAALVKFYGFEFVSQMMIGLPGATAEDEIMTAETCCDMGADAARIYPTVVFKDSELCDMTACGEYMPLSLDEAVERTKNALYVFYKRGVPCIRVGLCAAENLSSEDTYYAGPNHPAIGELAENALYLDIIREKFAVNKDQIEDGSIVTVLVSKGCLSKAIGQKRKNKVTLEKEYHLRHLKFAECDTVSGYDVKIEIK